MSTNDEMKYALQLCITELLHDGVPTDPAHPRRVALDLAEKARASNTATVEQAEDVVDLIRKGFITSQSCGPDKHCQLVVKFQSLAELQAAHNAIVLYPKRPQPRAVGVSDDEFNEGDRVVWTNMFGDEFTGKVTARDVSYSLDLDDGAQVKEATRVRAAAPTPAPARSAS